MKRALPDHQEYLDPINVRFFKYEIRIQLQVWMTFLRLIMRTTQQTHLKVQNLSFTIYRFTYF